MHVYNVVFHTFDENNEIDMLTIDKFKFGRSTKEEIDAKTNVTSS